MFKAISITARIEKIANGGSLWKTIPLVLLLCPRWSYTLDIVGVVALLAARHYPPSAQVADQREFHAEHEKRLGVDALGILVISSAGAPLTTRIALLAGTAVLFVSVHFKYPRRDVGFFDAINQQPSHMPVLFRKVGTQ